MFKRRKFFVMPESYIFSDAKEAMDKLSEVSGGKNFQYDIKPYPGILEKERSNFIVRKENDIWYLRIC
jgi:hypothetical protein